MSESLTFKPGDEVAIAHRGYAHISYKLTKVEHVTPSGRVTVKGGIKFDANGQEMGRTRRQGYSWKTMHPANQEIRDAIRREELISNIRREVEKSKEWDLVKLERVWEAIQA